MALPDEEIDKLLAMRLPQELAKAWSKERDPQVLLVLTDWLLENDVEPEPVLEALKNRDDNRIRRENMEWVIGEQGNLETEPMRIQSLSMEVPPAPFVGIMVDGGEFGQALIGVQVPAERAARIIDVKHRTERGDPSAPRGSYAHDPVWHTWREGYPFPIDEAAVIRQAVAKVGDAQTPWVGTEGELFYPAGSPSREWLYMEYAPEHLQSQLERRFDSGDFITLYTDGGYQTGPDEAFVDLENDELYQLVHEAAHSAEVECPLKDWDPEERVDARNRRVTVEDTFFGEHPHKSCRFCETEIGEEHGYLYVGEGGEYVYVRVPEPEEEEERERDPYRGEPRFPQGTTFVAAAAPLNGSAHVIDLQSVHVPDDEGHYVNPRTWQEPLAEEWDLSEVTEGEFGEEVGVIEIEGRRLRVFQWNV